MPDNVKVILSPKAIIKGPVHENLQHYMFIAQDADEDEFFLVFAVERNYTDSVEKAFSRLQAIKAPGEERQKVILSSQNPVEEEKPNGSND